MPYIPIADTPKPRRPREVICELLGSGVPMAADIHVPLSGDNDATDAASKAFMASSRTLVANTRMNRVIAVHAEAAVALGIIGAECAAAVHERDKAIANGAAPQQALAHLASVQGGLTLSQLKAWMAAQKTALYQEKLKLVREMQRLGGKAPPGENPVAVAAEVLATNLQQMYTLELQEITERRKKGQPARLRYSVDARVEPDPGLNGPKLNNQPQQWNGSGGAHQLASPGVSMLSGGFQPPPLAPPAAPPHFPTPVFGVMNPDGTFTPAPMPASLVPQFHADSWHQPASQPGHLLGPQQHQLQQQHPHHLPGLQPGHALPGMLPPPNMLSGGPSPQGPANLNIIQQPYTVVPNAMGQAKRPFALDPAQQEKDWWSPPQQQALKLQRTVDGSFCSATGYTVEPTQAANMHMPHHVDAAPPQQQRPMQEAKKQEVLEVSDDDVEIQELKAVYRPALLFPGVSKQDLQELSWALYLQANPSAHADTHMGEAAKHFKGVVMQMKRREYFGQEAMRHKLRDSALVAIERIESDADIPVNSSNKRAAKLRLKIEALQLPPRHPKAPHPAVVLMNEASEAGLTNLQVIDRPPLVVKPIGGMTGGERMKGAGRGARGWGRGRGRRNGRGSKEEST